MPEHVRAVITSPRNPAAAVMWSFLFMGLGQIYNRQIAKGILFIIGYCISIALILAIVGLVTTPVLWLWGMLDAYHSARRINAGLAANEKHAS